MSYYVRRRLGTRQGWTGPIRSRRQVEREAQAWRDSGWEADVEPSTPEVRAEIRQWERDKERAS